MSEDAEKRYETLDGMRGIAAIAVMLMHVSDSSRYAVFKDAALAVDLFFMLSGFVIAHSYSARVAAGMSFAEYIGKRVVRLYPLFVLGVALGVVVLLQAQDAGWTTCSRGFILASFLYNALFIPDLHGCGIFNIGFPAVMKTGEIFPGNPPLWSLFFEMVASCAFFPLTRLSVPRLARLAIASYALLLLLSLAFAASHGRREFDIAQGWGFENFTGGFPRVLFGFSVGMALHALVEDRRFRAWREFVARNIRSPLLLYALLIAFLACPNALGGLYPALFVAVVAPCLIYAGAIAAPKGALALGLARRLGWISYPVYCLHLPIARAVYQFAEQAQEPRGGAIVASIGLTLVAAVALTRFYDEPMRSFLSRRVARRLVAPPPTDGFAIAALARAGMPGERGDSAPGGDAGLVFGDRHRIAAPDETVAGPGKHP